MRACTLVKCVYLKNVGMNWSKKMTAPQSLSEVAWNWKAYNKLSKKNCIRNLNITYPTYFAHSIRAILSCFRNIFRADFLFNFHLLYAYLFDSSSKWISYKELNLTKAKMIFFLAKCTQNESIYSLNLLRANIKASKKLNILRMITANSWNAARFFIRIR